eukprot:gnl/MRDRNA2_/MRDRNA2_57109_c0_seq1.p2 gnl/MRDRNA2_/MRDRNA2_57109_c0~~gnl/MRDRNA2_/MRDRNA2_57109_c0_seq1.p2  ORF type:complete len:118 (-),score=17.39 gnl/MRDRNA2_/MRDRNA2_57109_c0_seq1:6-359(-)
MHSPMPTLSQTLEAWKAMEQIHNKGGAHRLGISNCYDLAVLQEICRHATVQPSIVQNRFYSDSGYDVELRAFCKSKDIQYQSFWTLTANPHILNSAAVMSASQRLKLTPAQVFFQHL